MEKQRYSEWTAEHRGSRVWSVNFWRVISYDKNEIVVRTGTPRLSPWQHICREGGCWGLCSKRNGNSCSFRPQVGIHNWRSRGFCQWSFHSAIETSSLLLCYGLKDWKMRRDITWNRISWYCAAWARRSKSHSLTFPCSTDGIKSVLFTDMNPNSRFYWISMSDQQGLAGTKPLNMHKCTETFEGNLS